MVKAKANLIKQEYEVEASKEEAESFLRNIIPDSIKDLSGILSDQVKLWRFTNQIRILNKAKDLIEKNNLQSNKVNLKVLVPLLDASSLEEDVNLQDKWANLLANATSGVKVGVNYVEILKELSGIDVAILEAIYLNSSNEADLTKRKTMAFDRDKIAKLFSLSAEEVELIIENFYRLGLCRMPGNSGVSFGDEMRTAVNTTKLFELTSLGTDFIKTCHSTVKRA